jgi:hypothetical protein
VATETTQGIPLPRLMFGDEANDFFADITNIYEMVMSKCRI